MKIAAIERFNAHGYNVEIHITPEPPKHQEFRFFNLNDVLEVNLATDSPFQKDTLEYVASVFNRHLPNLYEILKEKAYKLDVVYSVNYY